MRLLDLQPQFLQLDPEKADNVLHHVDTIHEADGVIFWCPKCYKANGGPMRTHSVCCLKPGLKTLNEHGPGRWEMSGTGYSDLTLSPAIQLLGGCGWHGFIIGGETVDA